MVTRGAAGCVRGAAVGGFDRSDLIRAARAKKQTASPPRLSHHRRAAPVGPLGRTCLLMPPRSPRVRQRAASRCGLLVSNGLKLSQLLQRCLSHGFTNKNGLTNKNRLNRRREQSIKAEPFYLLNRVAYWLHTGLGPSAEPQCEKDLLKPQTETLYFAAPGKQAQGIHSFMRPSSLHVAVRFWCGWWATPIISPSVCQMREWKGGNDAQFPRRSIDASGNPKAPKRPACRPAPAPCQRLHTSRGGAHSPRGSAPARRSWC